MEKLNEELKEENEKLNVIISYLEETMILEDNGYFRKYQADKKL